ncbi:MAG: hypothetical protein ABI402_05180 [Ferruginibacter sp.]
MKSTTIKFFVLAMLAGTLFISCNANDLEKKAEATAINFYQDLQKKDYKTAVSLCSDKAFADDTKGAWELALKKNTVLLGELKSFTKTSGFNIQTSTSLGTTVIVTYDVQWQYGMSKDSVILIKEKDGNMKVYRYAWDHTKSKYLAEVAESEKQAAQYMDAIKSGNYDAALKLCSDSALRATAPETWKSFFDKASEQLGTISNYSVLRDSSYYNILTKGQSGEGNYYDIYVKSNRNGADVMEKITFFQKDYDEPVKLVGHTFL